MGLLNGESELNVKNTESTSSTKQQQWQEDALKRMFAKAEGMEAYGGERVAGWNPYASQGMQNMYNTGNFGQMMGYNQGQQGQGLSNNLGQSNDFYQGQMNSPSNPYAGGPDADFLNKYTNNPAVQAQIDGAANDMTNSYNQNQRTGIASNAVGNGGSNSSRRHMMDSLGQDQLNNNIGNMSSGVRMNMLNQGLGAWESGQQQQNQNMWNGANQFNNMGMYGNELSQQGFAATTQGANNQMQSGQYGQGFDQAGLDNGYMKHNAGWENLNNMWNIVGQQSWGQQTDQSTTSVESKNKVEYGF